MCFQRYKAYPDRPFAQRRHRLHYSANNRQYSYELTKDKYVKNYSTSKFRIAKDKFFRNSWSSGIITLWLHFVSVCYRLLSSFLLSLRVSIACLAVLCVLIWLKLDRKMRQKIAISSPVAPKQSSVLLLWRFSLFSSSSVQCSLVAYSSLEIHRRSRENGRGPLQQVHLPTCLCWHLWCTDLLDRLFRSSRPCLFSPVSTMSSTTPQHKSE